MAKAFAFDIDGVLVRGGTPLPGAKPALELLNSKQIPWILLTNGGGKSEKDRVADLSEAIGLEISPDQFMQSHTPFKDLVHKTDRVLVIGGDQDVCRHIAKDYGFKDVVLPCDIGQAIPTVVPYSTKTTSMTDEAKPFEDKEKPFDAIFVYNDTRDATADVQIIVDLLLSENGVMGTRRTNHSSKPSVPIYFSNGDLEWSTDHEHPRIGQGALIAMIKGLYRELTGHKLECTVIGKPTKITYDFASRVLNSWTGDEQSRDIYMVGDNQLSDIRGANNYGWKSVLVRSGVYQDGDKLVTRPTYICDDVLEAVKAALDAPSNAGAGGSVTSIHKGQAPEQLEGPAGSSTSDSEQSGESEPSTPPASLHQPSGKIASVTVSDPPALSETTIEQLADVSS